MKIMSVCTDCNKTNLKTVTTLQNEAVCETTVHETVCVQGTVTITPSVTSGESTSFCIGNPIIGRCIGELQESCSFTVSQNICVQIPLTFSATASAVEDGIVCSDPDIGPCEGTGGCTHTRGFFQTHDAVVTALLAAGPITLGLGDNGFSFTVTTLADAQLVFTNAVPSSPNPQYNQLYAQLLTAQLNVRNLTAQGVAICQSALDDIAAANNLLALEEIQPNDDVSGIQEDLAEFNEGNAQGCPVHCV
jgi:hypothetical protein